MTAQAGSAYIAIRPDLSGFHKTIQKELQASLGPIIAKIGEQIGQDLKDGIGRGLGDPLQGPLDESTRKQRTKAPKDGEQVGGAFADGFSRRLKAAFEALPKAKLDADSTAADRKIAELRARMEELSKKTIGVDIDAGQALAELAAIKAELDTVGRNARIDVKADTAAATAELAAVQAEVDKLDGRTANVKVDADTAGALSGIGTLAIAIGGLAAIPVGATLGAGILSLVGPLAAAGAGFGGLAAVAVPAISHISDALKAQKQATAASAAGAVQAQAKALAEASAQQQLASAVRNAGFAHQQALQQVTSAQQQLTSAEQSAANAERALTAARATARQQLQDIANQVIDAQLAVRQSTFGVADAQTAYNKVLANPSSTQDQIARSKLALDQAKQTLREQQLSLKRLQADQKAADKAGVDGSNAVRAARQSLAAANLQVANSERALAAARANVARTDQNSADQVAAARRAVTQASLQGASANSKLAASMAALSPAERGLMRDWQGLRSAFSGWAKALEPDVLPLFSKGIDLVKGALPSLTPMVKGAAGAVNGLLDDVGKAANSPFWTQFRNNLTKLVPTAITDLGRSAGNVAAGMAGIVSAFLPYAPAMLRFIEEISARFATWGKNLGQSQQFADFMAYVQRVTPVVMHDVVEIATALGHVVKALSAFGPGALSGIGLLASLVGKMPPGLLQAIALGWLAIAAAQKAIGAGQNVQKFLTTIGFLSKGGDEAAKGLGGVSRAVLGLGEGATRVRPSLVTFQAEMDGTAASVSRTKTALAGLGGALFTVGAIILASPLAKKLHDELNGTSQDTDKLGVALRNLGQSGKFSGALLNEFKGNVITARNSIGTFQRDAKELVTPDVGAYVNHAFNQMFSWLPGVGNKVGELRGKFKDLDTTLTQMVNSGQTTQAAAAFAQLKKQLSDAGIHTDKINSLFPTYTRLVGSAAFSSQQFTQKINSENAALSKNAHAFGDSQQELIDFRLGLAAASDSLRTNGRAFFGNSQQALANRQTVLSLGQRLQQYSDYLVDNNQVTKKNVDRLKSQRDQLIDVAAKFLGSKEKAKEYVNQLVKIPKSVKTKLNVAATGQFQMKGVSYSSNPFNLPGRAGGGLLNGPGDGRSDSILARVSRDEFIVNSVSTRKYLPLLARINDEGNHGTSYRGKGYAGGGLVNRSSIPAFAGGGILDTGLLSAKTVLSGKLNFNYGRLGESDGSVLTKAAAGVHTGGNESNEFSIKQAALAAAVAIGLLGGGGSAMVELARKYIGYHEGPGNSNQFSHALGRPSEEWCFSAGTLVDTPSGLVPIEELRPGSQVLTPSGAVACTSRLLTRDKPLLRLTALGVPDTLVTEDHPYWVRCRTSPMGRRRELAAPGWVKVRDLKRGDMIALPIPADGTESFDPALAYVAGMYLADGHRLHSPTARGVQISDAAADRERIVAALKAAGYEDVRVIENRTCLQFTVYDDGLYEWCGRFGDLAHGKRLPGEVFAWDRTARQALLDGYTDGDGSYDERNGYRATTVSRVLAHDLGKLVRSLGWVPNIQMVRSAGTMTIEGREVRTRDTYGLKWKTRPSPRPQTFEADGKLWVPVRSIEPTGRVETVYDLTVPGEHAFVADGAHVSNCADFIDFLALKTGNRSAVPWTASAPGMASAFGGRYRSGTSGAVPGDIVFFGGSKAGIYHVGLAAGPGGAGSIPTIAGNSSNMVRAYTGTGIAGYAHPAYANPGSIGSAPGSLVHASPSTAKAWGRQNLNTYGWQSQFNSLDRLWTRESGWRWNALNRGSGAYGIPQSLPASKMRSAGADYRDNAGTQIKWGLGYIADRYGSPNSAWAHSQRTGWYDNGGWLQPGLTLAYNASRKPEPVLSQQQWADISALARGGEGASQHTTYHLTQRDITLAQLEALQRRKEALDRMGRPH